MHLPDPLQALLDDGQILGVLRQLKSGKEATVFVVDTDEGPCAAKVYKGAQQRSFHQRQDYTEGRRSGDSRMDRAMGKGSRFGREQREAAWQTAESATMHRLHAAGVRIPRPRLSAEGVLLMDLVLDHAGEPAPQIACGRYERGQAIDLHRAIVRQVQGMLCAGVVHADLSEYNILLAPDGPIIIDLPQAVDAARNTHAKRLLVRDIANVTRFFARFAPELRRTDYGTEMWLLHEQCLLKPDTPLTGRVQAARQAVDDQIVLQIVAEAKAEAAKREEIRRFREEKAARAAALRPQQPPAPAPRPAAPPPAPAPPAQPRPPQNQQQRRPQQDQQRRFAHDQQRRHQPDQRQPQQPRQPQQDQRPPQQPRQPQQDQQRPAAGPPGGDRRPRPRWDQRRPPRQARPGG